MESLTSRELLASYLAQESAAATRLYDRYAARLLALAASRLESRLRAKVDADDIVQSTYRSFFVGAREGEFELTRAGDLWRLLATIALRKVYGQVERFQAAKRRFEAETEGAERGEFLVGPTPRADEIVAAAESLEAALDELTSDERTTLVRALQGEELEALARQLGKAPRTLRRYLADAKRKVERRLLGAERSAERVELPAPTEAPAPLHFADYVLEKFLGSGGMGRVYRARHKTTGRLVTIKALHKCRQTDPRAVAQLVHEARILQRLRHPHIVRVEGLGKFPGGGYFLVMEYVEGTDLQQSLAQRAWTAAEALTVIRPIASALEHAHAAGIVHCDIKPANILRSAECRIVVTDFGFAQLRDQSAGAPSATAGGTLAYLAPELLWSDQPPTPAADVYSLGPLWWTLVVGRPPREGDVASVFPVALSLTLGAALRCRSTAPDQRFRSPSEFVKTLESVVAVPE